MKSFSSRWNLKNSPIWEYTTEFFVLSGHVLLVIYISDSSPIDDVLLFSKYVMLAISMTRPELSRSLGRSVVVGLLVLCFVD